MKRTVLIALITALLVGPSAWWLWPEKQPAQQPAQEQAMVQYDSGGTVQCNDGKGWYPGELSYDKDNKLWYTCTARKGIIAEAPGSAIYDNVFTETDSSNPWLPK